MANTLSTYIRDSFKEMHRVSWPTKNQAVNLSIIVISFVAIAALVVAGLDYLFNMAYAYLLTLS